MKLRIKGNSIRLRLLRSEVERFASESRISEATSFGGNTLKYSLAMSGDAEKIYAEFEDNEIRVFVPETQGRDWATNLEVGFETQQALADDETLTILVEKDFACLDRPDDPDRNDAFENPHMTCHG